MTFDQWADRGLACAAAYVGFMWLAKSAALHVVREWGITVKPDDGRPYDVGFDELMSSLAGSFAIGLAIALFYIS